MHGRLPRTDAAGHAVSTGNIDEDLDPRLEPEHDAHLQAALRHAPDATVAAPPSLREAILQQARIAARVNTALPTARRRPAPTRPRWLQGLDRATRWLGRPAVAAGFASVAAATLIGLMWWDRPLDELVASSRSPIADGARTPPAAAAPHGDIGRPTGSAPASPMKSDASPATALGQAAPAARSETAPSDTAPSNTTPAERAAPFAPPPNQTALKDAPPAKPAMVEPMAQPTAPSESAANASNEGTRRLVRRESSTDAADRSHDASRVDSRGQGRVESRIADEPQATDAKAGGASDKARPGNEPTDDIGTRRHAPDSATAPPAQPTTRAEAPVPHVGDTALPPSVLPAAIAAPAPTVSPAAIASPPAPAPFARRTATPAQPPPEARARMQAAAAPASAAPAPLAAIATQIDDDPSRWRWRRDDGAPQAIDDRVTRWVRAFDRTSTSVAAGDPRVPAATPNEQKPAARPQAFRDVAASSIRIELLRDGRLQATLRIDSDGVLTVLRPDAPITRAQATPTSAALAELRAQAPTPR